MNKDLMRKVADAIEANQDLYDQTTLGSHLNSPEGYPDPIGCNTPACIAGWTMFLSEWSGTMTYDTSFLDIAADILGIRQDPVADGGTVPLFCASWPVWWFLKIGVPVNGGGYNEQPSATDAATILRAMVKDGEFWPYYEPDELGAVWG